MPFLAQRIHATLFTLAIIAMAAWITWPFFLPVSWAVIMAVASWPMYRRIRDRAGKRNAAAAFLATMLVAALLLLPALLAASEAARQAPAMARFISNASQRGIEAPAMLAHIPLAGPYLHDWWAATLAQPHGLEHLLSGGQPGRLLAAGETARLFGARLVHRLIDFGFALLSLFFFYKDGPALCRQFDALGQHWLGAPRWQRYAGSIPHSIRATVNGLVLVGLGEGVLIGFAYLLAGLPSAVAWGALTALLAIVPLGAPLAFLTAAALLLASGNATGAIVVAVWGMITVFVADHLARPRLIGGATRLPFLAVLFGILGGLEALGLIGLFIGPVIMMLFITLWREPERMRNERLASDSRQPNDDL
jgi:predicted PurR-regulated permease PerM